jgi:hypothetical protein
MVSYWTRTDRVSRAMTEPERERRDQAHAGWADLLQQRIAISPTIADDERARRAERARQIVYANERRERARQEAKTHVGTNHAYRPHHHLKNGGTV